MSTRSRRVLVLLAIAVVLLGALPGIAAAETRSGGTVIVESDEVVDDDLDVFAGTVIVRGTVTGDLSAVAGNVQIEGDVDGDVSGAAGNVEIRGSVGGDVAVAGGNVLVAEGATVGGTFEAGAGNAEIRGTIDGDAQVGAETIVLGDEASIAGSLRYDGDLQGNRDVVAGDVTRDSTLGVQVAPSIGILGQTVAFVYTLVLNLLLGAALLALFPRFSDGIADRVADDPLRTGGLGFLVLVGVPLLLVAVAITVVGIPVTVVATFVFLFVVWVAIVYGRYAVGEWLLSLVDVQNRWLALVVGLLLGAVLGLIPFLGGLVNFLIFLLGLGALAWGLYVHSRRSHRGDTVVAGDEAATP